MDLGVYFSFIFSLNLMISFFLIWPGFKEEESPKKSWFKIFLCFLFFTLLCGIFSQLGYLLSFIFPVLFSSKFLAYFTPVGIVLSFFGLLPILFSLSFVQHRAVSIFVLINSLTLFYPFGQDGTMRSPLYVLFLGVIPSLAWVFSLLLSGMLIDKFELEMPKFSIFNFPILIISVGLILLMLTPLWV